MTTSKKLNYKLPINEADRLQALQALRILDTAPVAAFDDLVQLAAYVAETPMAALSLIDKDRQWFKARVGLDVTETGRDVSFCTHTILNKSQQPLIVNNALLDPRFAQNPLVTGEPNIRFYVGIPIMLYGSYAVGSLCVIDREPRELSAEQVRSLQKLARMAIERLERHVPIDTQTASWKYLLR